MAMLMPTLMPMPRPMPLSEGFGPEGWGGLITISSSSSGTLSSSASVGGVDDDEDGSLGEMDGTACG